VSAAYKYGRSFILSPPRSIAFSSAAHFLGESNICATEYQQQWHWKREIFTLTHIFASVGANFILRHWTKEKSTLGANYYY